MPFPHLTTLIGLPHWHPLTLTFEVHVCLRSSLLSFKSSLSAPHWIPSHTDICILYALIRYFISVLFIISAFDKDIPHGNHLFPLHICIPCT